MKIISLEIGSSAVKAGLATYDENIPGSPLTIDSVVSEAISNSVRYGRILNVEDVTAATAQVLERLGNHPGVAGGEITGLYVSVGGRSLASVRTREELRIPEERLVDRQLTDRLSNEALGKVPEGKEPLEIVPLGYRVNGVHADRAEGTYASELSGEFTVVYADPLNARNIERVVNERLNRNIWGFMVRPIAIADAVLSEDERNAGCMLVDMGAETTTCSVYANGVLQYVATIPMGGRNITRDLAVGMGLTEEKAERIKCTVGKAMNDNGTAPLEEIQIDNFVQARASEILANVIAQIQFAGYTDADMRAGIIVTGGAARLHSMCQLLSTLSGLKVRMATVPTAVHIADPAVNSADNIDIIALSMAARTASETNGSCDVCITYPEPEPEPEPEIEEPEEPEEDQYTDGGENNSGYDYEEEDVPAYSDHDSRGDEDDTLMDDEEIEARRARERERRAKEELAAAKERNRKIERENTSKRLGFFINRVGTFLQGSRNNDDDGEGNDL